MTFSVQSSHLNESIALPSVRIDSLDEEFVLGIREYLESNGCQVYANKEPPMFPLYHIVCGNTEFVKTIFAQDSVHNSRHLVILWEGELTPEQAFGAKIALVDGKTLTHDQIVELFGFFVASGEKVLKLRSIQERMVTTSLDPEYVEQEDRLSPPVVEHVYADQLGHTAVALPQYLQSQENKTQQAQEEQASIQDKKRIEQTIVSVFGQQKRSPVQPMVQAKDINSSAQETQSDELESETSYQAGGHHKTVAAVIFGGLLFIMVPFIWYAIALGGGLVAVSYAAGTTEQGKGLSSVMTKVGNRLVAQSTWIFSLLRPPLTMVGAERMVRRQERLLSFLQDAQRAQGRIGNLILAGSSLAVPLLQGEDDGRQTTAVVLRNVRLQLEALRTDLGLAQAQLSQLLVDKSFPFFTDALWNRGEEARKKLAHVRGATTSLERLLTFYPLIGGFDEKRQYLILLQNSMELRPGGGFIGSVALATFSDGKLADLHMQDVYEVDGQLKGHVDPPAPIRDLLTQEHWYLRDSNWDADFRTNAARALWFYEKETGVHVDGVIAISLPFIVDLLKATGPIYLSDYDDTITAENFFGKSLYYIQGDFFPGSTQKKDFLGVLSNSLMDRLAEKGPVASSDFLELMQQALEHKDIQVYFTNEQHQMLAQQYGWAGALTFDGDCRGEETDVCFIDQAHMTEANMSVSKVNYFISRSIVRNVSIGSDGTVVNKATLRYHNEATGEQHGLSGTYRTYVNMVLPADAIVSEVLIDGQVVRGKNKKDTVPSLPYVERIQQEAGNYQGVGIAFDVPMQSTRQVTVVYARGKRLSFANSLQYTLMEGKQAGIVSPYRVVIQYPSEWEAKMLDGGEEIPSAFLANQKQLEYNTDLSHDTTVRILFRK